MPAILSSIFNSNNDSYEVPPELRQPPRRIEDDGTGVRLNSPPPAEPVEEWRTVETLPARFVEAPVPPPPVDLSQEEMMKIIIQQHQQLQQQQQTMQQLQQQPQPTRGKGKGKAPATVAPATVTATPATVTPATTSPRGKGKEAPVPEQTPAKASRGKKLATKAKATPTEASTSGVRKRWGPRLMKTVEYVDLKWAERRNFGTGVRYAPDVQNVFQPVYKTNYKNPKTGEKKMRGDPKYGQYFILDGAKELCTSESWTELQTKNRIPVKPEHLEWSFNMTYVA